MKKIIQQIHESDTKAMIVEIGAGTPISSKLFSVAGASKTVFATESPYSREYCELKYGHIKHRTVSYQRVESIINYYSNHYEQNFNTIIATSFQIGDETNKISTHGWIGLKTKEDLKYYHISIHKSLKRKEYIKIIGRIGVLLLNGGYFENSYIDIVLDKNGNFDYHSTLEFLSRNTEIEQMVVFGKNETIDRLESITREENKIVIFKGSFNPPTIKHLDIIENVLSKYKLNKGYFMISVDTVDKGIIDVNSLIKRIEFINKIGYDCIVTNNGYFQSNINFIRNKFDKKIIFPVGSDTVERMEKSLFENENVIFESFKRDEKISSTKIRNAINNCNISSVLDIIPSEIIELL